MQTGLTLECRVQHPFRADKAASKNAEKLHAVFICYELYQKSRQAAADIENAMKIIIAEQASCPIPPNGIAGCLFCFLFPGIPAY